MNTESRAALASEIQASIDDPRPAIPHDQVMREIRETLAQTDRRKDQEG